MTHQLNLVTLGCPEVVVLAGSTRDLVRRGRSERRRLERDDVHVVAVVVPTEFLATDARVASAVLDCSEDPEPTLAQALAQIGRRELRQAAEGRAVTRVVKSLRYWNERGVYTADELFADLDDC